MSFCHECGAVEPAHRDFCSVWKQAMRVPARQDQSGEPLIVTLTAKDGSKVDVFGNNPTPAAEPVLMETPTQILAAAWKDWCGMDATQPFAPWELFIVEFMQESEVRCRQPTPAPEQCCKGLAPMNECNKSCGGNKPDPTPAAEPHIVETACQRNTADGKHDWESRTPQHLQCRWCHAICAVVPVDKTANPQGSPVDKSPKSQGEPRDDASYATEYADPAPAPMEGHFCPQDERQKAWLAEVCSQCMGRKEKRVLVTATPAPDDLAARLRLDCYCDPDVQFQCDCCAAAARIVEQDKRIAELRERLEHWGTDNDGNRVELPESCDGIACRDATITLQDEIIAALQPRLAEATKVIAELVGVYNTMPPPKPDNYNDTAGWKAWVDTCYANEQREATAWQAARAFLKGEK